VTIAFGEGVFWSSNAVTNVEGGTAIGVAAAAAAASDSVVRVLLNYPQG
jgi:predicted RecA/RadA family phage recombinase